MMDNKKRCKLEITPQTHCPNIENTYEGWDSETWECKVCGVYFKLYYEDMA